ncbi:MAG: Flp pilus assembly complex ATPase component TadA, partial [Pseudomonadales bacterium]|nr:Flp pilus assembly complex ATPase component TadA [Pseudomonadales bacterium]
QELNRPEVNIMTVEDPVERRLPGINQIQVNKPVNVSFASVLRAFLRQDPDVILIGEIRDLETAKIASEAALTGHLVLSTMHTNSALQAITRLMDIGVEPFLVAPSIIGVMGQRLLRKLCPNCKESYRPSPEQLEPFFTNIEGVDVSFCKPVGCDDCDNTGYQGRVAIHELFNISDPMRSLISRNGSLLEIEELARQEGFRSMRYDALKRVLQGITSIDEVIRVVPD